MARHELPKEDLLRDATAFPERVELSVVDGDGQIVVGFRADGAVSFFFGDEPVYQFNSQSELRRAFVDGCPFKAEQGRLVRMDRERGLTPNGPVSQWTRYALDDDQTRAFLNTAYVRLCLLGNRLSDGTAKPRRCVPSGVDVAGRAADWLGKLADPIVIAQRPHATSP